MTRKNARIMIVDDEAAQGKALNEAFTRAGYDVTLCTSSTQAAQLASRQEFHALIVDCMLPKMNGVALVEQINSVVLNQPFIVLYSGIFKDKTFQRESITRTKAAAFLTKPFQMDEMMNLVNAHFAADQDQAAEVDPLLALYGPQTLTKTALDELFRAAPTVAGIHLPMIYRRLQVAGASGELSMVTTTGDLNTVCLHQGHIFAVRTPDPDTAFGTLSVCLGLLDPEDLAEALENPEQKLIGQKLIESVSMSPHALELVMQEQLALRLSQTIEDGALTLNWAAREFPAPDCTLSLERFQDLADDWTTSKIEAEWIRDYLMAWGQYELNGPAHARFTVTNLDDLLSHPEIDDERDLPYLLRQLINGNVTVGAKTAASDYRFLETRLTHLLQIYPDQSYFEILGIGEKAHSLEINRAYEELRRHFDPANLAEDVPPRVMLKATQVFKFIATAYETLSDEISRNRYVLLQVNQRGQMALENEPAFRQAVNLVTSGRAVEAASIFQDLVDKRINFPDLRSYRIWAKLTAEPRSKDFDFEKIPPEDRHSAPYHMARGLYFRGRNELHKAAEHFTAALVMDSRLTTARAELEATHKLAQSRQGRSILGDLGTSLGLKVRRGA